MEHFKIPHISHLKYPESCKLETCINSIIDICEKHVFGQTSSIQGIINICSQFSSFPGSENYCNQIVAFCNQIISETFQTNHTIINICKTFSQLEVKNSNYSVSNSTNEFSNGTSEATISSTISKSEIPDDKLTTITPQTKTKTLLGHKSTSKDQSKTSDGDAIDPKNEEDDDDDQDTTSNGVTTDRMVDESVSDDSINQEDFPDWSAHWLKKKKNVDTESTQSKISSSKDPDNMLGHIEQQHEIKKDITTVISKKPKSVKISFPCTLCTKRFSTKKGYMKHEAWHANGGKQQFKCDQCEYMFPFKSLLENHIRIHTGERPFICEVCGNAYAKMSTLKQHHLLHTDERPEECEVCGYRCKSTKMLKRHMVVHSNEKKYQCDECGMRFARGGSLTKHRRTHKNDFPFSCKVCPKRFKCKVQLQRHEKVHGGLMEYSCKICGKRSRQKYNITVHMRTHNGEKPYKCEMCGKSFAHNVTRRQHRTHCFGKVEVLLNPTLDL